MFSLSLIIIILVIAPKLLLLLLRSIDWKGDYKTGEEILLQITKQLSEATTEFSPLHSLVSS